MTPLHVGEVQNWIDMGRLHVPEGRLLTMKVRPCRPSYIFNQGGLGGGGCPVDDPRTAGAP